jgi:CRP-like cAMP-binding protein
MGSVSAVATSATHGRPSAEHVRAGHADADVAALRHLFPAASETSVSALVRDGRVVAFERHAKILADDDEPAIALIAEGYAGTWRSDADARSQLVALNGRHELVGLLALGPHRRAVNVVGLTDGRATTWAAEAVLALARRDAGLASDLLQHALHASERLLTRLEHVGFDPVARRLARLLWQRRDVLFDARRPLLTRPQLGDLAGATREMTDRVIRDLERDAVVRRIGRAGLVLVDPDALRELAGPDDDDPECS